MPKNIPLPYPRLYMTGLLFDVKVKTMNLEEVAFAEIEEWEICKLKC